MNYIEKAKEIMVRVCEENGVGYSDYCNEKIAEELTTLLQESNEVRTTATLLAILDIIEDIGNEAPVETQKYLARLRNNIRKRFETLNGTAKPNDTTVLEELKKSAEEHNKNNGKYKLPEGAIPMENTTEHDKKIAEDAIRYGMALELENIDEFINEGTDFEELKFYLLGRYNAMKTALDKSYLSSRGDKGEI